MGTSSDTLRLKNILFQHNRRLTMSLSTLSVPKFAVAKGAAARSTAVSCRRVPVKCSSAPEDKASTATEVPAQPLEAIEPSARASEAAIDPADGTVQYGAALRDEGEALVGGVVSSIIGAFSDVNAIERINGRVAMMGFDFAVREELLKHEGIAQQLFNDRVITLAGGVQKTLHYPKEGVFLLIATVLLTLVGSLAPSVNGEEKNGLTVPAEQFAFFKPEAELKNGRWAMVGLVSMLVIESVKGGSLL